MAATGLYINFTGAGATSATVETGGNWLAATGNFASWTGTTGISAS
jgi:hypothetical protein